MSRDMQSLVVVAAIGYLLYRSGALNKLFGGGAGRGAPTPSDPGSGAQWSSLSQFQQDGLRLNWQFERRRDGLDPYDWAAFHDYLYWTGYGDAGSGPPSWMRWISEPLG